MGIKHALASVFRAANYPAIANQLDVRSLSIGETQPADLGPGISGTAGEYYGSYWGVGTGGDGSKWQYGLSSTGSTPLLDHTLLRLNSRSAYHDSMQGRAIIDRFADLVPGTGLKLEATPNAKELGISPEEAEAWAEDVESRFDSYMRSKRFSLAGDMTGYQVQRFVAIQQMRDGEYFARLHYNREADHNPLQVSFLDPTQVIGYPQTDTAGFYLSDSGIQYDEQGREVSYNVCVYNYKNNEVEYRTINRVGRRSDRLLVLHGYQREYPFQRRGYSRISHILQELELLTDFEASHIKKAIIESMIGGYVKPSKDHPASDAGFGDMMTAAPSPYEFPDNPATATEGTQIPSINLSELNEINARPGSLFNAALQGGEDLKAFNGQTPAENYHTFVDAFMKSLCASVSLPYELVWMRFGENYSASRAALVLAWQVVEIWRAEMASDFLNPIYEMWLSGEIAAGRIKAPGWSSSRLRHAWLANGWVGFPMPNIDPSKTADADEKYINMGATTLDRVARQLNGTSGKVNRAKQHREFSELAPSPFLKTASVKPSGEEDAKKKPGRPLGS